MAETDAVASFVGSVAETIYLIRKLGVFGARQYAGRMPSTERWDTVRSLLKEECNSRQTAAANISHLDMIRNTAR